MVYSSSCEEHKYLAGIRREKEAFERLIKERGVCVVVVGFYHLLITSMIIFFQSMLFTLTDDRKDGPNDAIIKTISSRRAGGRRELNTEPSRVRSILKNYLFEKPGLMWTFFNFFFPQVIVDMREFRSTLPSLLHASNLLVIPATLTIGHYILTPEICREKNYTGFDV